MGLVSETEATVTFNCKGDPTDPHLCVDLFPCNLDRQQLMYRLFSHEAKRKNDGPLQCIDKHEKNGRIRKFVFEAIHEGVKRKFEFEFERTIEMKEDEECNSINFAEKWGFNGNEVSNVHTNKEKALLMLRCMKMKFHYIIGEVQNGKVSDRESVEVLDHSTRESKRRRLLQAGGAGDS